LGEGEDIAIAAVHRREGGREGDGGWRDAAVCLRLWIVCLFV